MVDQEVEKCPSEEYCMDQAPTQNTLNSIVNKESDKIELKKETENRIDRNVPLISESNTIDHVTENVTLINHEDKSCQTVSYSETESENETQTVLTDHDNGAELNCKLDHIAVDQNQGTEPFMNLLLGDLNTSEIEICGVKCKSLIDTGSSMTTMSQSLYDQLTEKPKLLGFEDFKLDIRAAGGSTVPYSGYIWAEIHIPFLHDRSLWIPVLIVQDKQYPGQVPVIIGTNAIARFRALSCEQAVPEAWDIAFQSLQDNAVGIVKSTNRRPITIKPMESKVITGSVRNCKVKEVLTEPEEFELSSSLHVYPRVVSLSGNNNFNRVPVKVCNISARAIKIQPHSQLCELHDVKVLRSLSPSDSTEPESNHDIAEKKVHIDTPLEDLGVKVNMNDLSEEQQSTISSLLQKWTPIFSKGPTDLGSTDLIKHEIHLNDDTPFKDQRGGQI